jgi:hypothetical protein
MRDTREVINKSEGAVVSVSIFLDRMVVQRERKTARVCQWDQWATCKKSPWEVITTGIYINGR